MDLSVPYDSYQEKTHRPTLSCVELILTESKSPRAQTLSSLLISF